MTNADYHTPDCSINSNQLYRGVLRRTRIGVRLPAEVTQSILYDSTKLAVVS